MKNNYRDTMSNMSSKELLKIVEIEKDDYEPNAIKAAEQELFTRSLSQEELDLIRHEIHKEMLVANQRANESLGLGLRILAALIPGVIQLIISGFLNANGYHKKAKQLTKWTLLGLLFYIILVISIMAIS